MNIQCEMFQNLFSEYCCLLPTLHLSQPNDQPDKNPSTLFSQSCCTKGAAKACTATEGGNNITELCYSDN